MSTIQRYLPHVARILVGLVFFVFGLNGFLHFLPQPPMEGAESRRWTGRPWWARWRAAAMPAMPAPTMRTGWSGWRAGEDMLR